MAILLAVFPLFMRWICCGHHMAMSVHLPFFCSAVCVGLRRIARAVASKDPSNAAAERFRAAGKHGRNGRYLTGATETAGWTARKKLHGRKKKHEQAQGSDGRNRSTRIRSDARRARRTGARSGTTYSPNGKPASRNSPWRRARSASPPSATRTRRTSSCSSATAWAIRKSPSPVTI